MQNGVNNTGNFLIRNNGSNRVTVNSAGEMGIGILLDEKFDVMVILNLQGILRNLLPVT